MQREYGGISKASVGVLLREMVELEQQGAGALFGEPELDVADLMERAPDGRGRISVLELSDVQDRPAMFSTFMMWMLAELYHQLPEVGDLDKPKLVFFFDEAHLLFKNASKAFLDQVEQVVRLVRSKGVGIFFVTQSPTDVPAAILGQLGNRVQHALRAFTPDDEKALRAAARTYPKTPFYDVQETLTTLGIGEALVTVLGENGAPSPPFVARIAPPASRMGPLTPAEIAPLLQTEQVRRYAAAVDRESAYEILGQRLEPGEGSAATRRRPRAPPSKPGRAREEDRERLDRGAALAGRAHDREPGHARPDGRAARPAAAPPAHAKRVVSANAARSQGLALTPTLSRKREREKHDLGSPRPAKRQRG